MGLYDAITINQFYYQNSYVIKSEGSARRQLVALSGISEMGSDFDAFMDSHYELNDLQVHTLHHSGHDSLQNAQEAIKSRAQSLGISDLIMNNDPENRFQSISTRKIYNGGGPGESSGSGGGIDPLDPNCRSGAPWSPIDTTQIAFSIYDAVVKGFLPARRPGRGGFVKNHPDRKATIRVLDHQGQPIFATTDFTVENMIRPKKERLNSQITFDELIARFGTERMKVYSFQGHLLDCKTFDWMRQWDEVWEQFLRGEVLARNLWRAYILYKSKIIGGYMVSCQMNESAATEPLVPFSFTMLVTDDENLPKMTVINSKDEDALYAHYEGSREDFNADLAALRIRLSSGTNDYSTSLETDDPNQSTQSNPDAD